VLLAVELLAMTAALGDHGPLSPRAWLHRLPTYVSTRVLARIPRISGHKAIWGPARVSALRFYPLLDEIQQHVLAAAQLGAMDLWTRRPSFNVQGEVTFLSVARM
jgi:hypothetical protein